MTPGRFITLEGGDGAGKSTQARRLGARLEALGHEVVLTREPGGSPFAERIRALLVSADAIDRAQLAETLLFNAARADHLAQTIRPALAAGKWVICDRFSDSTRAYQGIGGGIPRATLDALDTIVLGPTRPVLTLVLDIDPQDGLSRARSRGSNVAASPDRFEREGLAYHRQLRDAFLAIAAQEPGRCQVIDAGADADAVAAQIWSAVSARLELAP